MTGSPLREAVRELGSLVAVTLGLGEDDSSGAAVVKGARYVVVQTLVAIGAGAYLLLLFRGGPPLVVALPLLPTAAAFFRAPSWRPAVRALGAGAVVAALAWVALQSTLSGSWLWFTVVSVGALLAGPLYGRLHLT